MRVQWAIPCLEMENQPNGLLRLQDACFNRAAFDEIPHELTFIVALRLAGQPEDFDEEADRSLHGKLRGPDMEEILDLEFEAFPLDEVDDSHPAGWEIEVTLPVMVRFLADAEGAHTIDWYVGDKYQVGKSVAVWVVKNPPASPQGSTPSA